jgi:hypothetical protein
MTASSLAAESAGWNLSAGQENLRPGKLTSLMLGPHANISYIQQLRPDRVHSSRQLYFRANIQSIKLHASG